MKKLLSALALLGCAGFAQAEVAVIVNAGASAAPSQADVANIFLGKDKSLKGVDQKDWNPTKEKFYAAVASKNESQLKSYWSGLVFTGKGQPLPSVAGDADVVAKRRRGRCNRLRRQGCRDGQGQGAVHPAVIVRGCR